MDSSAPSLEVRLPRPWEEEIDFADHLYSWMQRAPWLALSAAAHLLVFFVLMAIPWETFQLEEVVPPVSLEPLVEEEFFEETPPEKVELVVPEDPITDPVLMDDRLADEALDPLDDPSTPANSPVDFDTPFEPDGFTHVIGIGPGGVSEKLTGRGRRGPPRGGRGTEQALKDGFEWLRRHQSKDGSWDSDGFMTRCGQIGATVCDGGGQATWDVGLTGLALLVFLGDRNTPAEGPFRDTVARGVHWLLDQQDPDTGLIGERHCVEFLYNHAIATLALCEVAYFAGTPLTRRAAQRAVNYIQAARAPYGAWRYDVPSLGDNDTSVTGWMIFALSAAKDAGLEVDQGALDAGLAWIEDVTDPGTGRVGYSDIGSLSSRTPANEHYPREKGEAMTAVGLLCRFFLGQDPDRTPVMVRHAELLQRRLPEWDPGNGTDMYYWYYGTYAMYQMGGPWWKAWSRTMDRAIIATQRKDGDELGSWDPIGPWGHAGGRVYATATLLLCLEVHFRYARVLGAR